MNNQSNESNPCQLCNTLQSQNKDTWTENPGLFTLCRYQCIVNILISIHHAITSP